MRNLSSQHMQAKITPQHLKWAQSVDKVLSAGIDMGEATGVDSSGVYNTFKQSNSTGVLIRVGANGSTEPVQWDSSGAVTVNHALNRQPIGFKLVDKDGAVDVYRTAVPTDTQIQLQTTDKTINTTVYIF